MGSTTDSIKEEFGKTWKLLATLRDELRVKMHLATLDARDKFAELEKRADAVTRDVDKMAHTVEDTTRTAVDEVVGELKKLKASIGDKG